MTWPEAVDHAVQMLCWTFIAWRVGAGVFAWWETSAMSVHAKGVLFATVCTLGLMLQGGLFGYCLGWWGTIASCSLGILEGRWAVRYLRRRAGVLQ